MNLLAALTTGHQAIEFYRSWGAFKTLMPLFKYSTGEELEIMYLPHTKDDNGHIKQNMLYWADVLFMDRAHTTEQVKFLRHCKENMRLKIWLDYDDNILQLDRGNPAYETYMTNTNLANDLVEALRLADVVTVSTQELQKVYSTYNENVIVVPNAFDSKKFPCLPPVKLREKGQQPCVAWRGSNAHLIDLISIQDPINKLLGEKNIRVVFFGWCPPFLRGGFAYVTKKEMFAYFNQYRTMRPEFLIVPLALTPFNLSKSNIAYIEGATAGSTVIAPDYMPEFKRPGVMHYSKPDEILDIIYKTTYDERRENVKAAQAYIRNELSIENVNIKRVTLLSNLFQIKNF